jgi:ribonuclease HII
MRKSDSKPSATKPDFCIEAAALETGATRIAGVDEAGRGPLAGPVVVAAVVFADGRFPQGLNDSKKLSARRREALYAEILVQAEIAIAIAPPSVIDVLNIRGATLWAMRQAVLALPAPPDLALIDGRDVPDALPCPGRALIRGDGRSVSIAAASIVAKVTRDAMCPIMDKDAAGYDFAGHKGYGTRLHKAALACNGASLHHRRSFAPVALTIG